MIRTSISIILILLSFSVFGKKKTKKQKTLQADTVLLDSTTIKVDSSAIIEIESISITDTLSIDTLGIIEQDTIDTIAIKKVKLKDTISIIGVGDIMLGTSYPADGNYLPPNEDCSPLMADVVDVLRDADITFGNLEGAMTDSHNNGKICKNPKTCYAFAMPTKFAGCLVDAGFDVMSMANNHSADFEYQGRKSTMHVLDSVGIEYAGLYIKDRAIFSRDSITYGFCAFAPNQGTTSLLNIPAAKKIVKELDSVCDIVIVSFHGGAEGSKYEHTPREKEIFLNLNRGEVYKLSHALIDAGADVIFGHGPHVTRAMDVYKDRFIIYSLGNFCTYKRFNLSGPNGMAPIIKLYTDREGKFLKGQITPVVQYDGVGTKKDPYGRVIRRLQQLTKEDFPEVPLKIEDSGLFYLEEEK